MWVVAWEVQSWAREAQGMAPRAGAGLLSAHSCFLRSGSSLSGPCLTTSCTSTSSSTSTSSIGTLSSPLPALSPAARLAGGVCGRDMAAVVRLLP